MELIRLGHSGMYVSEIVLGCMSYGVPDRGTYPWSIDFDSDLPFFEKVLEPGTTTFDTADVYSDGTSEEIVGRALGQLARRDDIVVTTKVCLPMREGRYGRGLSRKHIMDSIDASLTRLGTDFIDLYQIHRFDPDTPVEETMQALDDVVRSGKVRYVGA